MPILQKAVSTLLLFNLLCFRNAFANSKTVNCSQSDISCHGQAITAHSKDLIVLCDYQVGADIDCIRSIVLCPKNKACKIVCDNQLGDGCQGLKLDGSEASGVKVTFSSGSPSSGMLVVCPHNKLCKAYTSSGELNDWNRFCYKSTTSLGYECGQPGHSGSSSGIKMGVNILKNAHSLKKKAQLHNAKKAAKHEPNNAKSAPKEMMENAPMKLEGPPEEKKVEKKPEEPPTNMAAEKSDAKKSNAEMVPNNEATEEPTGEPDNGEAAAQKETEKTEKSEQKVDFVKHYGYGNLIIDLLVIICGVIGCYVVVKFMFEGGGSKQFWNGQQPVYNTPTTQHYPPYFIPVNPSQQHITMGGYA